jgi:benzoylformate decarboxylase
VDVRGATFEVMRQLGMIRIFGNPGSTEISFLADLPDDIEFILGLHEGSVVGMASGYAIAREQPAFVNLHTAPGLGNAINAIANARECRAPLVIVVGQQDRRQLAHHAFLTGRALERLAGEYPVWSTLPVRAEDVPGAIARAYHEAQGRHGPALVVVPMGDWVHEADPLAAGAPKTVTRPTAVNERDLAEASRLIEDSRSPAIVVGAGAASVDGWKAVTALAEKLGCPVWQEAFGSRAGFPQNHPLFAGHLPWMRRSMQERLAANDLVLVVGTHALRAYLFDEQVPLLTPGTRVAVISDDSEEVHRSPCDLGVVADVAKACSALVQLVSARASQPATKRERTSPPPPLETARRLRADHVLAALAERLPADVVLVEETPSSRPQLVEWIPARTPLGFISTGSGALGFGLPGAIGIRMALRRRPVVAVVGDGSAMYAIQSLWSASRYGVGVLLIVLNNGGYAIMDALAEERGARAPWPGFGEIDLAAVARALGCPASRSSDYQELILQLDDAIPTLHERAEPLLIEVLVAP